MKQIICGLLALLMILSIILSLAACGSAPEPVTEPSESASTTPSSATQPTADQTEATTEPVTEPVITNHDLPISAISITEQTETQENQSGNTVFEYTYQNIRLVLPDGDMSIAINLDILNRIDATRSEAVALMNSAMADNPTYPYALSVLYFPMRIDQTVLSLFGQQNTYSGGGHASNDFTGLTYDLSTGNVLTLGDVLVKGTTSDAICPLVIEALGNLPEEYRIYDDYALTVEERFSGDLAKEYGWYLSKEGLGFVFAPYEVAPYSTGFVHGVIPYEKLTGILEDIWFPAERVTPDGALEVLPFSQENAENFDQFAELYLDRDGQAVLLHATGLIYDVTIEYGNWNTDGSVFTPEQTVFVTDALVASNAVIVQSDIPDAMPHLRITYTTADGSVTVYLSASGEDGTPLLVTF